MTVAVAGLMVTVAGAAAATSTARAAAAVIDPGTVVRLSDPGVELTAPGDGRVRGDGIALVVTGAALADQAGTGYEKVTAGPGRHLIVFAVRRIPQPDTADPVPVSLALVAAGERRPVDLTYLPGDGPWNFAAAVPAGVADVHLELTAAGFTNLLNLLNLLNLTRPGPDPVALYRDVDNPAVVDADNSGVGVAVTTGPPDSTNYHLMIGAATTTIAWFAPDATIDTPPVVDRAFLTVHLAVTPDPGQTKSRYLELPTPVPAADVHLTLGDGTRLAATHTVVDETHISGIDTLFAGSYYFAVPADIAAATLTVDAYHGNGYAGGYFVDPATITINAFTITLALSAPPPAPPATTAPTVLKLTHPAPAAAGSAGTPGAAHGTGTTSGNTLLAAALVVCAGAAAVVVARRRQTNPPLAAPHPIAGTPTWPMPPPDARDRLQPQPTAGPDPPAPTDGADRPPPPVRNDTATSAAPAMPAARLQPPVRSNGPPPSPPRPRQRPRYRYRS